MFRTNEVYTDYSLYLNIYLEQRYSEVNVFLLLLVIVNVKLILSLIW